MYYACCLKKKNAIINKNESSINKLRRSKQHPLIRKFSYVTISNIQ